jgi:hypothetical protein
LRPRRGGADNRGMKLRPRASSLALLTAALAVAPAAVLASCAATRGPNGFNTGGSGGAGHTTTGTSTSNGGGFTFDAGHSDGSTGGGVPQTCADAIKNQSYIGCEYWPTVTSNSGLYSGFSFAIAAANPTMSPATVTVERDGTQVAQVMVAAGDLQTLELPWVDELKGGAGDGSNLTSILLAKGAYKVTASVPITLYQFNPLEFQLQPAPIDCPDPQLSGDCFSFTNDASILLPTSALRGEYYVMGYPTMHLGSQGQWIDLPGFVTISATADGTQVTVDSTANVRGGPGVGVLTPGQQGVYHLDAGDVLQLETGAPPPGPTPTPTQPCVDDPVQGVTYCPSAQAYDLTGSHIVATKPVSVIAGHDCTFVPFSSFACDHIEESIFPVETLGKDLIVTAPITVASIGTIPGDADNMFVRVLSAADNNTITFDPPVHGKVTLGAGKWIEIGPVTQDFRVSATDRVLVGQYMVGENFGSGMAGAGDPSLSIAIPTEQYRVEYTFLAPSSYTYNIVNVVTTTGATISIDGTPIPQEEFVPIGSTGKSVARHVIDGGTHKMLGSANFGIVVYGYGSYTSYMYPGGLNLETINIVPG